MDIQQTATQLINFLGKNPQLITQFIQHPYSTTAQATGSDAEISKTDMSQVVTAAAAMANNQPLPANDVANIASALLGQNNNSVHSLTSMLFGGGNTAQATQQAQAQTTSAGTLDLGSLVNMASLAATLMSGMSAASQPQVQQQPAKPQINLSDGLDLGEIAMLAGQFLGSSAATPKPQVQQQPQVQQPQVQPQPTVQPQAGLDFGTIAQLASLFLKQQ